MLRIRRVYESVEPEDGTRFLVDRLWPRGLKREALKLDDWLKQVAPSINLRKWFHRDPPARWEEFLQRYFVELDEKPHALDPIREALGRGNCTLLFSARDTERNNAVVLKRYMEARGMMEIKSEA